MYRPLSLALSAATAVAAFGLSGCSPSHPRIASTPVAPAAPATSIPTAAPPTTPLPAPEALTDILSRLADPNVPGINKVGLVEGATPENAAALDNFINALRDNGYLPMTFAAKDIAWSDKNPANVMATISVNTAQGNHGSFTFPMEFTPFQGGWQLSRRTAEMLLALGKSPAMTTAAPGPPPPPSPEPVPPPAPAPTPSPPG
jgi:hypothetical protein